MEIKACPFCRSDSKLRISGPVLSDERYVVCDNFDSYGPSGESIEDAIKLWNAAPRKEDDHMGGSCLNCKFYPCSNKTPGTFWCSNWKEKEDTKMEQNCRSCKYNLDGYCGAVRNYCDYPNLSGGCHVFPAGKPFIDDVKEELTGIRIREPFFNVIQQIAEEAVELAKAAIKYGRTKGLGSYTTVNPKDARDSMMEEFADVLLCMEVAFPHWSGSTDFYSKLERTYCEKAKRWLKRLKAHEE